MLIICLVLFLAWFCIRILTRYLMRDLSVLMEEVNEVQNGNFDVEIQSSATEEIYVLTQRPGTVKAEVPVLLPYNRDLSLKDTDEFIELRRKVNQLIEHESLS